MRNNWVNSVKDIIENSFKKGQVPWFNFGMDPASYQGSKMQKYFRVVKYLMETSLRDMCGKSFNRFYEYIISFIPDKIEIVSIDQVKNHYGDKIIATTK